MNTSRSLIASLIAAAVLATGLAVSGIAAAQAPAAGKDPLATPRIDKSQANQQARIDKGVAAGKISPTDQTRLQAQQNQIAANKAAAKADGVVTKAERKALREQQKQASRDIKHSKHTRRTPRTN
jgi:uncharacterized iron-regulated membrane protein